MKEIEFGNCLFKFSAEEGKLYLHSSDIYGVDHTHNFYLAGAFLVNIGGNFWRFVTGAEDDSVSRHLFEDVGVTVDERVNTLRELGVPVLNKDEGKQNLEYYQLPVKRLMLTT